MESLGPQAVLSANKVSIALDRQLVFIYIFEIKILTVLRIFIFAPQVTYGTMSRVVLDATLSEDRDNSEGELRFYCPFKKCNKCIFL